MKLSKIIAVTMLSTLAFSPITQAAPAAADKAQIEQIVHDYIMKNPEVIIDAVKSMQEKQMSQMRDKTQEVAVKKANLLFNATNDPVAGNPNGSVTLVEFFDYQCPHCVDMVPAINSIIKANPDLRVVYKEFPIRGPVSLLASKAALAAQKQGKYTEMHEALMKDAQNLNENQIYKLAEKAGLNVDQLKKDMNSSEIDQQVKANYKLAQELQLIGTPAMFVGKTKLPSNSTTASIEFIPGQVDQQYLQNSIDKAKK